MIQIKMVQRAIFAITRSIARHYYKTEGALGLKISSRDLQKGLLKYLGSACPLKILWQ
jgi:hypothetical protein